MQRTRINDINKLLLGREYKDNETLHACIIVF